MVSTTDSSSQKNRILAAVPQEDFDRFFASLQPVSLTLKEVLHEVGAPLDWVYFIEQGVASVLTSMANGASIEVGMIGREGIVGVAALLGGEDAAQRVIVQVPGTTLKMPAAKCRAAFEQSAAFRAAVLHYTQSFLDLSAQTAACNRLHSIEQRGARWLLMARDRIDGDVMPMTHEFLATMLGVRRAQGAPGTRFLFLGDCQLAERTSCLQCRGGDLPQRERGSARGRRPHGRRPDHLQQAIAERRASTAGLPTAVRRGRRPPVAIARPQAMTAPPGAGLDRPAPPSRARLTTTGSPNPAPPPPPQPPPPAPRPPPPPSHA